MGRRCGAVALALLQAADKSVSPEVITDRRVVAEGSVYEGRRKKYASAAHIV